MTVRFALFWSILIFAGVEISTLKKNSTLRSAVGEIEVYIHVHTKYVVTAQVSVASVKLERGKTEVQVEFEVNSISCCFFTFTVSLLENSLNEP